MRFSFFLWNHQSVFYLCKWYSAFLGGTTEALLFFCTSEIRLHWVEPSKCLFLMQKLDSPSLDGITEVLPFFCASEIQLLWVELLNHLFFRWNYWSDFFFGITKIQLLWMKSSKHILCKWVSTSLGRTIEQLIFLHKWDLASSSKTTKAHFFVQMRSKFSGWNYRSTFFFFCASKIKLPWVGPSKCLFFFCTSEI